MSDLDLFLVTPDGNYTWDAADLIAGDDGSAHVFLLATVLALDDGITFPGYATVLALGAPNPSPDFVPWDNNLAQQNVVDEFTSSEAGTLDFEVHKPSNQGTRQMEIVADTRGLPPGWGYQVLPPSPIPVPALGTVLAEGRSFRRRTPRPGQEVASCSRGATSRRRASWGAG